MSPFKHYLKKTSDLPARELVVGLLTWWRHSFSRTEKQNDNPDLLQQLSPFEMPPSLFSSNWIGSVAHMESCRDYKLEAWLNITPLVIGSFYSHTMERLGLQVYHLSCYFFQKTARRGLSLKWPNHQLSISGFQESFIDWIQVTHSINAGDIKQKLLFTFMVSHCIFYGNTTQQLTISRYWITRFKILLTVFKRLFPMKQLICLGSLDVL